MQDLRQGTCPLCSHSQVIKAQAHEYYGKCSSACCRPLSVTEVDPHTFFGGPNSPDAARGVLWLYVCRKCGYAQWFAEHPEKIPIGEELGTSLIEGPVKPTPFR